MFFFIYHGKYFSILKETEKTENIGILVFICQYYELKCIY